LAWTVNFEPRARNELKKLDRSMQLRVVRFLEDRIAGDHNPRDYGKPLVGDKAGFWRYRIGDCRVVCRIEDDRMLVLVVRVAHRKEVYR
jgi:mRNA interferase RelE/StbE